MVPNEIISVDVSKVQAFLGRVSDPEDATEETPKESAFRTIMFTDIHGSTGMTSRLGDTGAMELLRSHNAIVRGGAEESSWDGNQADWGRIHGIVLVCIQCR